MAERRKRLPRARPRDQLVLEELPGELLVYDIERHRAHCLNRAAALVFTSCDGHTTRDEMLARLAAADLRCDDQVLDLTLDLLAKAHLLELEPTGIQSRSRRAMLKKLGLVAGAAVAFPIVQSIVAPSVAQAASCVPLGKPCNGNKPCCAGVCIGRRCV